MSQLLKKREKFFYGMGNLGYGAISQTYNNFIMFFGTTVIGISGTLMGLAVAISVFWDAITDPIIGYLSDRQNNRIFGKRHGFMLLGFIGVAIFNIILWSVPSFLEPTAKFIWLLISMLGVETFNTFFATPYTALGAELSDDYNERTNIQAYKSIFFLISFIIPSVLMYIFLGNDLSKTSQQGYMGISIVTSIMALLFGLSCVFGTFDSIPKLKKKYQKAKQEKKEKTPTQIFKMFFYSLKRKNYNSLVGGYAVGLISSAIISGVGLHLFTYAFHFTSIQIAVIMGGLVLATIISQPFWVKISKKFEKKTAVLEGILITLVGVGIISIAFLIRANVSTTVTFVICLVAILISGFGTGSSYSVPISMFADLMTIDYAKTGKENAGLYSGFMTMAYKTANAVALLVIGVLLDVVKFNSELEVQPLNVQNGLGLIAIAGIVLSQLGSYVIYSQYTIKREQVNKANKKILKVKNEVENITPIEELKK